MKFRIVIPTFNSAKTLPAAVESALAQEHDDFFVVVSDNGSTDGSAEYLRGVSHPRLQSVLNEEKLPKTENWNRAFSQGPAAEYLVMLHSDDVLYPQALQRIDETLRRFPDAVMVFGNHDRLAVDGGTVISKSCWPLAYCVDHTEFARMQLASNNVSVVGATFRADAFQRIGGFDRQYDYVQDLLIYDSMSKLGPVAYSPHKFGQYRDTPIRPAVAPLWAREQMKWIALATSELPASLRRRMIKAHAAGEIDKLHREAPEAVKAFVAELAQQGIQPGSVKAMRRFQRVTALALKLKASLFSLCSR